MNRKSVLKDSQEYKSKMLLTSGLGARFIFIENGHITFYSYIFVSSTVFSFDSFKKSAYTIPSSIIE